LKSNEGTTTTRAPRENLKKMEVPKTPKSTRGRDPLSPTVHEHRYEGVSLTGKRFATGGNHGMPEHELSCTSRVKGEEGRTLGKRKRGESTNPLVSPVALLPLEVLSPPAANTELFPTAKKGRMKDGAEERRRNAIAHLFVDVYGSPPLSEWPSIKTAIMARLSIPAGSRNVLQLVFEGITKAAASKKSYDAKKGTSARKLGKFLIREVPHEGSPEAESSTTLGALCLTNASSTAADM